MKKTIRDYDLSGKRVLIRVDFNVPLDDTQNITDDNRIQAALPTIQYALEQGASRVVLMSHLGRPKGQRNETMSLKPVAEHLIKTLKRPVIQCSDCVGSVVQEEIQSAPKNAVIMLENLRFHKAETENDQAFAKELSVFGNIYVNDAFGTSHRAHASVEAITKYLPSSVGFLVEKEIQYLGAALEQPKKPFVVVLGGAKVSDKINLIENLIQKVDKIIIGGAMAYTFKKVKGLNVGMSRVEVDKLEVAKQILEKAKACGVQILLPTDHVVIQEFKEDAAYKVSGNEIEDGWEGVDIGPETTKAFQAALRDAKTVVWNGPMGVFEMKNFKNGSLGVAQALANNADVISIIGGGDTAACVIQFGLADKMSHISTGGGASLEFLEGKKLPGIESIQDKCEESVKL